jgi:phosphohistidine phosphatase
MRHAKAQPFAATDHERELTDRGHRAAGEAGQYLASTGAVPDHAVVSTAARAVATWEGVAKTSGSVAHPRFDGAVYAGSADVALDSLRVVPTDAEVVIFVGHNPTAAYLAHLLDDGNGEPAAVREMLQGYPAGAMAVLEVEVAWSELGPETGRLVDFHVGRG